MHRSQSVSGSCMSRGQCNATAICSNVAEGVTVASAKSLSDQSLVPTGRGQYVEPLIFKGSACLMGNWSRTSYGADAQEALHFSLCSAFCHLAPNLKKVLAQALRPHPSTREESFLKRNPMYIYLMLQWAPFSWALF